MTVVRVWKCTVCDWVSQLMTVVWVWQCTVCDSVWYDTWLLRIPVYKQLEQSHNIISISQGHLKNLTTDQWHVFFSGRHTSILIEQSY